GPRPPRPAPGPPLRRCRPRARGWAWSPSVMPSTSSPAARAPPIRARILWRSSDCPSTENARAAGLEHVGVRGPGRAIGIGDRPPVLLPLGGPTRIRQGPQRHHSDPWLPVLSRVLQCLDDIGALLLFADGKPGVIGMDLIG